MPSTLDRARRAARNNADLCAAVMAANGLRTQCDELAYVCVDTPLPYYPKVVTLEPGVSDALLARIGGHGAVKDSFSCLNAQALGLRVAFGASWIWSDARFRALPRDWVRIDTADDLSKWHRAWSGTDAPGRTIFPPRCLKDPGLVFLARMPGTRVEAGCLANRSADAIGLSNVFSTVADDGSLYPEALAAVSAVGGGLPVVGYERGDDLDRACAAGFEVTGPLRILVR